MKHNPQYIDILIDKLTNSIENTITHEVFETEVTIIIPKDKRQIKKSEWVFDWHREFNNPENRIFKLTTINNPSIIQGLISCIDKQDHIFLSLIECAGFNRGKSRLYRGVADCCKVSFERGYEGIVSFIAKSKLIEHYNQTLGAKQFGGSNRMFIDSKEALTLAKYYFKISIMANYKKMDDHDFVFINTPFTDKEEKEFSEFLKSRKTRLKSKQNTGSKVVTKPEL